MPRTIQTEVFTFDELTDSAKEKAREWYRTEVNGHDSDFADCVTDMADSAAKILGIHIDGWNWSGFWSQGDGAAFRGRYSYAKGAAKAIRKEFPQTAELHSIADALQSAQRKAFYRLTATCETSRGNNMRISVEDSENPYRDCPEAGNVEQALESFAYWFYRALEMEHEYQNSAEVIDELMDGYEFDEDGNRA